MVTIHLTGKVTEDGELVFETPKNLPPGEAKITIELPAEAADNEDFTEEEIREIRAIKPKSGKEIVEQGLIGGWEDMGITDSVAWVEEQRRKRRERNRW
jgi:hypothetical protein